MTLLAPILVFDIGIRVSCNILKLLLPEIGSSRVQVGAVWLCQGGLGMKKFILLGPLLVALSMVLTPTVQAQWCDTTDTEKTI